MLERGQNDVSIV